MTIAKQNTASVRLCDVDRRWLLKWCGLVTCWTDGLGTGLGGELRQGNVALVIVLEPVGHDRAAIEAWVELPGQRRSILAPHVIPVSINLDGTLLHIDCPLVSVSLELAENRLLYARTPLLARAGFRAGSADPPTAELLPVASEDARSRRQVGT